jgi:peptide/nickel transport system ATP-binding protein
MAWATLSGRQQEGRPISEQDEKGDVPLLSVRDLHVRFRTAGGVVRAVNGLSYDLRAGETLAIVGESGSGKSVSSLALMQLLPASIAEVTEGTALFDGRDLLALRESQIRRIRGNAISMIFQEPMTSLDPVMTVGRQIGEAIAVHQGMDRRAAEAAAVEALTRVRVPDPARRARQYPFQLSGGLRQRVMIAMAMACNPRILIADEPTTALDVTIQAQILTLMDRLRAETRAAILLITHDLGVVSEMADKVVVMYAGQMVERAPVEALFARPRHPYTLGLLGSVPRLYSSLEAGPAGRLQEIPGTVPSMRDAIPGCAFAPRCPLADARCGTEAPPVVDVGPSHQSACWHHDRVGVEHV